MKRINFCLLALVILSHQPSQAMKETEKKLKKKFGDQYTMLQITSEYSSVNDEGLTNSNNIDLVKFPKDSNESYIFSKDFKSKKKSLVEKKKKSPVEKEIESHINTFHNNRAKIRSLQREMDAHCAANRLPHNHIVEPFSFELTLRDAVIKTLKLNKFEFEDKLLQRLMNLNYLNRSTMNAFSLFISEPLKKDRTKENIKKRTEILVGMLDI